MTLEVLLRDVLNDDELKAKYGLSNELVNNARLSPPYAHPIIEYLATLLKSSMDQNLSEQAVYNQIKNVIKIS